MSSRRLFLLLILGSGSSDRLAAQEVRVWQDSAKRLAVAIRALKDSLLDTDSTVTELSRTRGLVIGSSTSRRATAMRGFTEFVQQRARWFGEALPHPDGFRIVVRMVGSRRSAGPGGEGGNEGQAVLSGLPDTGAAARTERVIWNEPLSTTFLDAYAQLMVASLPAPVARWLDQPIPFALSQSDRRYQVMYEMMTGAGNADRGCVRGRLGDCAYLLNLREPVTAKPGGRYPEHLRADLLLLALESGGPQAWERFAHPAHRNAEAALVAASGVSADTLLGRWRESVLALRPDTEPLEERSGWVALGWTALVLAGTLGALRWR